jgi:putative drug exporter of the RND superfamily
MLGVGLAVAVLLDATVVRGILVPAALALLGDRSWQVPRWLGWLPGRSPAPAAGAVATRSEPPERVVTRAS